MSPSPPATLQTLPTELLQQILTLLPLSSLLTFSRTSKHNYTLSTATLTTLNLAVFPKRFHGVLALLNVSPGFLEDGAAEWKVAVRSNQDSRGAGTGANFGGNREGVNLGGKGGGGGGREWEGCQRVMGRDWEKKTVLIPRNTTISGSSRTTSISSSNPSTKSNSNSSSNSTTSLISRSTSTSSSNPLEIRHTSIHHQNALLANLLSTPSLSNLHALTIHTTALLSPCLSRSLAQLSSLRNLTLNFCHPYVHDTSMVLPPRYWTSTPQISDEGTPAWNALSGIGVENDLGLRMRGLLSLRVTRAAVTARQMSEWVRRNPDLKEVGLRMVSGVDGRFVRALAEDLILAVAETEGVVVLRVLNLHDCANLVLREEGDFAWIDRLVGAGLRELSFRGCEKVNEEVLVSVSQACKWDSRGLKSLVLPSDEMETKSCDGRVETGCGEDGGQRDWNYLEVDPACA